MQTTKSTYLYSYFFWSIYCKAFPIVVIVNENTPHATNKNAIPNNLSNGVCGDKSPYPIVVIVATAQYTELIYLTCHVSS